jgi:deoxyribodipyrimidine photo-lyase
VKDLLQGLRKGDGEVLGVWMTSEEGVEEKNEEREVRKVIGEEGKEFRLLRNEKYFVDEFVCSLGLCFWPLTLSQSRSTF